MIHSHFSHLVWIFQHPCHVWFWCFLCLFHLCFLSLGMSCNFFLTSKHVVVGEKTCCQWAFGGSKLWGQGHVPYSDFSKPASGLGTSRGLLRVFLPSEVGQDGCRGAGIGYFPFPRSVRLWYYPCPLDSGWLAPPASRPWLRNTVCSGELHKVTFLLCELKTQGEFSLVFPLGISPYSWR